MIYALDLERLLEQDKVIGISTSVFSPISSQFHIKMLEKGMQKISNYTKKRSETEAVIFMVRENSDDNVLDKILL